MQTFGVHTLELTDTRISSIVLDNFITFKSNATPGTASQKISHRYHKVAYR